MRIFLIINPLVATVALATTAVAEPTDPAHALAQKFAAEDKLATKPSPASTSQTYEKEMLDAARAEAEARRPSSRSKPVAVPRQAAAPKPVETQAAPAKPSAPQHMQIRVEARIAAPAPAPQAVRDNSAPRASVLVVLTAHAELSQSLATSDPVICLGDTCYVSAGPDKDALAHKRADVLSTRNTITNGAGACRGKKHCAFRGVSIPPGAPLQVIDLGIIRHDSRESVEANIDATCKFDGQDLVCENPVTAPDHRLWIVPETVASSAGPAKLEEALNDELPEEDVARADDK